MFQNIVHVVSTVNRKQTHILLVNSIVLFACRMMSLITGQQRERNRSEIEIKKKKHTDLN